MVPELDQWAAERELRSNGQRKTMAPRYSPHEMEAAELFRRVAGVTSYKASRDLLAGDRHRGDRVLLGFDVPRQAPTRGNPLNFRTPDVPSEAAMSKYRCDIGDARRADLRGRFLTRLREVWTAEAGPDGRIGASRRLQHADRRRVSEDGPQDRGDRQPRSHHGAGRWLSAPLQQRHQGRPRLQQRRLLGRPRRAAGPSRRADARLRKRNRVHVLGDFCRHLGPLREELEVGVASADAAFATGPVRQAIRRAGFVDNLHEVSHGDKTESYTRAETYDRARCPIQGYPNWHVNGHRELSCACGQDTQERDAWRDPDGTARVRVKGRCPSCGSITLLSGRWRRAKNPARFVPMLPADPREAVDLPSGNPLTYRDRMAARYGKKRWVRGEGAHGVLKSHYRLNTRRRYRSRSAVELETNMVFAVIVSLAIQQREHERAASQPAPLPVAA